MYLLGIDVGSSSVKASILEISSGKTIASAYSPKEEMEIIAHEHGWAEQHPEVWIENMFLALQKIKNKQGIDLMRVKAIGISYQMHGLVMVDNQGAVLRSSIIWCDSRAVEIGNKAFEALGEKYCLTNLLNSPGNFTASKLRWVQENERSIYNKAYKIMLPGDYLAFRLTGEINTTQGGLSEGIMWDYKNNRIATKLLNYYNINPELIPEVKNIFSIQGLVSSEASNKFGLPEGIPVSYRAGDQPNNAFSLNVINPGEIAATAGTSAVVYGVTDKKKFDPKSRVNTFLHVNNDLHNQRLGVIMCLNGAGIVNAWLRKNVVDKHTSYEEINEIAQKSPVGSNGLLFFPFGNGAERILENKELGGSIEGFNFNIHTRNDLLRAVQEGIVFSLVYGMEIMKKTGIDIKVIKAGKANMFLSPIFRETLAGTTGATIQLYNTDGAEGAARGAGFGAGIYRSFEETFKSLEILSEINILTSQQTAYKTAYDIWKKALTKKMKNYKIINQ